eukprot:s4114_g2.t1
MGKSILLGTRLLQPGRHHFFWWYVSTSILICRCSPVVSEVIHLDADIRPSPSHLPKIQLAVHGSRSKVHQVQGPPATQGRRFSRSTVRGADAGGADAGGAAKLAKWAMLLMPEFFVQLTLPTWRLPTQFCAWDPNHSNVRSCRRFPCVDDDVALEVTALLDCYATAVSSWSSIGLGAAFPPLNPRKLEFEGLKGTLVDFKGGFSLAIPCVQSSSTTRSLPFGVRQFTSALPGEQPPWTRNVWATSDGYFYVLRLQQAEVSHRAFDTDSAGQSSLAPLDVQALCYKKIPLVMAFERQPDSVETVRVAPGTLLHMGTWSEYGAAHWPLGSAFSCFYEAEAQHANPHSFSPALVFLCSLIEKCWSALLHVEVPSQSRAIFKFRPLVAAGKG